MADPNLKTYDDVRKAFDNGTVIDSSRRELEQLLIAVGRERILNPANQARASEMGETMRQLLAARQSQELHDKATRIAIIALVVSLAAFLVATAQLVVALRPPATPTAAQPPARLP